MKPIYLIYETDPWHSTASMSLIAVATTEKQRDTLVSRYLRTELYHKASPDLVKEALKEIRENNQTQCLSERCDLEIVVEEAYANTIL